MTKRDDLPIDPAALEKWQSLPQNPPSKSALPPATGGLSVNRALVWGIIVIGIVMGAVFILSQSGR